MWPAVRSSANSGPRSSKTGRTFSSSPATAAAWRRATIGKPASQMSPRATSSDDGQLGGGLGYNLTFPPGGRFLPGVHSDGRIGLLSTVTGSFVRVLTRVERPQSAPAIFTPDGRSVVTVLGGPIQFWEVATG